MSYTTLYKDILFIEGDHPKAVRKQKVTTNIRGIGAQMKSLNDIKDNLVSQAKLFHCNCVLEFKYGQKTSWFSFDDVKFYGSGVLANIPLDEYEKIREKIEKS